MRHIGTIMNHASNHFAIPQLMDWTILPAKVIARAWVDSDFKQELINHPATILQEASSRWPSAKNKSFIIVEDSESIRHLILPFFKTSLKSLPRERVLEILKFETGEDTSLKWFLPAEAIAKAFFDQEYKKELLQDASMALKRCGYVMDDLRYRVVENTVDTSHLVLPINPLGNRDRTFQILHESLIGEFSC